MGYYCSKCKKIISSGVYSYSMDRFNRALCIDHQKLIDSNREKKGVPEQKLDVVPGAKKIMRGVSQVDKEIPILEEIDFTKWTADWKRLKQLDFSMETSHFFLTGMNLDDYTKQLIRMAREIILIANPYLDICYLTEALIDSAQSFTKIKVVTRYPGRKEGRKGYCHMKLKKANIQLRYDRQIHSKIIVVDNEVAVVSSMNFYSGSSGGASKEAGIVSLDKKIVESAANYISKLHARGDPFVANTRLFP